MVVLASLVAGTASAQDTRRWAEPKIPTSCVQLPAQLQSMSDKLDEADEHKLDTARIQAALDECTLGMGVELKPSSGNMPSSPDLWKCVPA